MNIKSEVDATIRIYARRGSRSSGFRYQDIAVIPGEQVKRAIARAYGRRPYIIENDRLYIADWVMSLVPFGISLPGGEIKMEIARTPDLPPYIQGSASCRPEEIPSMIAGAINRILPVAE